MAQDTFVSMAGAYDKSPCSAIEGNPNQLGEKQERKKPKTKDQMVENRKNLSAKRGSTITRLN